MSLNHEYLLMHDDFNLILFLHVNCTINNQPDNQRDPGKGVRKKGERERAAFFVDSFNC